MTPYIILPDCGNDLTAQEALTYLFIRAYMNSTTKTAFPSIDTLVKNTQFNKKSILKYIRNLEEKNYLKIEKQGRSNLYRFNDKKTFEPFSKEFLFNDEISKDEKMALIKLQPLLFKSEGFGSTTFSDKKLSELTGFSWEKLQNIKRTLMNKNILTETRTNKNDDAGFKKRTLTVDLLAVGQQILFERVDKIEKEQLDQKKEMKGMIKEINRLKEELKALKEQHDLIL